MFEEEEGDDGAPVPALMVKGEMAMAQRSVILTLALWNSSQFYVVYRKLLKRHR
jgi:hypothetical protein